MGRLLDTFRMTSYQRGIQAAYVDPTTLPYSSPWAGPTGLSQIVYRDVFGDGSMANSRGSAMRIGAVRRARNLLVSTISDLPLIMLGPGEEMPNRDNYTPDLAGSQEYQAALRPFMEQQPSWLYRSDDGASPQHRMAWTVDDLIFHPASLWQVVPDASTGRPLKAQRVNRDRWTINADNRVEIDGAVASDEEVRLIPGLSDGILTDGIDILRDARSLGEIVRKRLKNPVPAINLQQVSGEDLPPEKIKAMREGWAEARNGEYGGVAFSNKHIKPEAMGGEMDANLAIEARNASAVDVARLVGVAASRIDASGVNSTLTYETTQGRNQELVDFDLTLYTLPILSRLSMDDCVPRGKRTAFDLSRLTRATPSVTGANRAD